MVGMKMRLEVETSHGGEEDVCGGGDWQWWRGRCVWRWRLAMEERKMCVEVETGHGGQEVVCGGGGWPWWRGG